MPTVGENAHEPLATAHEDNSFFRREKWRLAIRLERLQVLPPLDAKARLLLLQPRSAEQPDATRRERLEERVVKRGEHPDRGR